MRRPRTLAEAELQATLNPTANVQRPADGRHPLSGIGGPEILFAVGFLMVAAGLALAWLPLGLVFAGATLALIAWKLA